MGIIKAVKGTNIDATEIRVVPQTGGDVSPVAGTLVERDQFGNINNYWVVGETDDISVVPSAQYIVVKQTSMSQHIVITDAEGTSSDLAILNPVGDYFRLGFTGEMAIIEIRRLG